LREAIPSPTDYRLSERSLRDSRQDSRFPAVQFFFALMFRGFPASILKNDLACKRFEGRLKRALDSRSFESPVFSPSRIYS
jgi:hypothetical protein